MHGAVSGKIVKRVKLIESNGTESISRWQSDGKIKRWHGGIYK